MGQTKQTLLSRIREWFWQVRYDVGMWLVVRCMYPDASPADFQLLDTKYFVAIERTPYTRWDDMTDDEKMRYAHHAMTGE